jgi:hypothetical protein
MEDVRRCKVDVLYFESISQFITNNSLASEPATAEEIGSLVATDEIAHLAIRRILNHRFSQGTVKDAELSPYEFRSGQKYRVAADSFYIEAQIAANARLVFEEPQISSYFQSSFAPPWPQNPLVFNQWKSPFDPARNVFEYPPNVLGNSPNVFANTPNVFVNVPNVFVGSAQISPQNVSGDVVVMPTVEKPYECTLEMQLSLRTTAGKRESLELDRIELDNLRPTSETPPKQAR